MADVFLSYSQADRDRVETLANALIREGYSVWWDNQLNASSTFVDIIEQQIEEAKAVLVVWSKRSLDSLWVRAEASQGLDGKKLVQVLVDTVQPPLPFNTIQHADLSHWSGDAAAHEFQEVVAALKERVQVSAPSPRKQAKLGQAYTRPMGAGGAPLFIAHFAPDKPRIAPIIEVLVEAGFPVWIDKPHLLKLSAKAAKRVRGIEFGVYDFKEQIRRNVRRARAVLAFWSDDAVTSSSEQFHYEVYMALVQGKLFQGRLDAVSIERIGRPFNFLQVADFSDFKGDEVHTELNYMLPAMTKSQRKTF